MTQPGSAPLSRVCLVISSFRNDDAVLRLLSPLFDGKKSPFGGIIVVDSLGTGVVPKTIAERGWEVDYQTFDRNLGSAGNLAKRLELAAATTADYAYAINHDGNVDLDIAARLLGAAAADQSVGAAYPLNRLTTRGGQFDLTGRLSVPIVAFCVKKKPVGRTLGVHWSSSNGALYKLDPIRKGLLPWQDLWMGWEDLGYGWLLEGHGYKQILVLDAVADEAYEYGRRAGVWRSEKASWYAYYFARNFLLVTGRTHRGVGVRAAVAARLLLEFGATALLRDDRRNRFRYLTAGIRDGLLGRGGKWRVP